MEEMVDVVSNEVLSELNQSEQISFDEIEKKAKLLNREWSACVNEHEKKNQEMLDHPAVTKKLHDALPENVRTLFIKERNTSFANLIDQRYMLLVDAYKKMDALATFIVNVKNEQLKQHSDIFAKIKNDALLCSSGLCLCNKYFTDK
jgi:hypothetical protein